MCSSPAILNPCLLLSACLFGPQPPEAVPAWDQHPATNLTLGERRLKERIQGLGTIRELTAKKGQSYEPQSSSDENPSPLMAMNTM